MHAKQLNDPAVIAHYQDAVTTFNSDLKPMLCLVERLCQKDYAVHFTVRTSHDTLIIGDRQPDCITVAYHPHLKRFQVRFCPAKGKLEIHNCVIEQVENLIDALALRLHLTLKEYFDNQGSV